MVVEKGLLEDLENILEQLDKEGESIAALHIANAIEALSESIVVQSPQDVVNRYD